MFVYDINCNKLVRGIRENVRLKVSMKSQEKMKRVAGKLANYLVCTSKSLGQVLCSMILRCITCQHESQSLSQFPNVIRHSTRRCTRRTGQTFQRLGAKGIWNLQLEELGDPM